MWGFFEVDTRRAGAGEAAQKLIETAACGFLQGKAASVFGPVNLNTWLPYASLRVDRTLISAALVWEPVNPPDYVEHFLAAGFKRTESTTIRPLSETSNGFWNRLKLTTTSRGQMDSASASWIGPGSSRGEASMLYRISNEAFEDSFLFETIPQALFDGSSSANLARGSRTVVTRPCPPQGDDVGFLLRIHRPAFSLPGRRPETYAVLKSTGVSREARGQRLSNALAHLAVKSAAEKGAPIRHRRAGTVGHSKRVLCQKR